MIHHCAPLMFVFMCFRISKDKLTSTVKFYNEFGVAPRMKRGGGRRANKKVLVHEDVERIVRFIQNFADSSAMPLPGRIPGFKRADIRMLPTTETKSFVWRKYKASMSETGRL